MFDRLISFIREQYHTHDNIPLHAPIFRGNERRYVLDTLDSTYVSSVGSYVDQFEAEIAAYTKSPSAVVTVNGTSALHLALYLAGVAPQDYVITQSLTFVATGNAIRYCQADPILIDVDKQYLGLSPIALANWLEEHAYMDDEGTCRYQVDHRRIKVCLPMHTFGHPVDMDPLLEVCSQWHLVVVEDAAESLGSFYRDAHTGTLGTLGILSFNGNKIITTGGGGMILSNTTLGKRAKHLTTTARVPHAYEFYHDEVGYNYRMPNLNAALGCAQIEQLGRFLVLKRKLAKQYQTLLAGESLQFITEPPYARSNYWLNAVICKDNREREALLKATNDASIMTRPLWKPLNDLPMFAQVPADDLKHTRWLVERVVNLPSSVFEGALEYA